MSGDGDLPELWLDVCVRPCSPELHLARMHRFCMGSNKVLKVALGKSEKDEHKPNLHLLSDRISGKVRQSQPAMCTVQTTVAASHLQQN